ncbi:MAG TPA: outer membrane beta-barrel protein [Mucilaginibacter sp.]|nr:outer membrane beta-barrel protein [Mucilaginibacter sp.]
MRRTILFGIFFLFFALGASAQIGYSVKGTVGDSVEKIKLHSSAVSVLQLKDSILVKFSFTGADGSFLINGIGKGKYILLVSCPDYADYVEIFSLDSANTSHDFGRISLALKSRLLKEVIIKGTAAQMKIKGDTTEFNAKAFVIQPNAKVEDLLKQLPGITVDKDGKITAEGQTVSKVLVDGEEFFGDDPTLVTRNIRADMVDKIQLYDKKSDQAAFTGVDDGKTQKTINVKLREDKKTGIFGKVQVGDGPEGIYQGELLFNAFKNKEKFSVYGTMGNNGKVGLSWDEDQKYGTGGEVELTDNGVSVNSQSPDDLDVFSGLYFGQGFPLSRMGGVHYDTKWDSDKQSVNANYKIESLRLTGTTDVSTQSNYPGFIQNGGSDQKYDNSMLRQKLSLVYQVKLDTSSNLKISVDGSLRNSTTHSTYISADTVNNVLANTENRQLDNTVDQRAFNGSAFYTHKFKKPGQTISFLVSESYSQSKAHGILNESYTFYNTQPPTDSVINEMKTNNLQSSTFNTNLTYSEPFTKTLTLVLNYGIGLNNASANRNTFEALSPGVYSTQPDDTLSSNYVFNQFLNHVGGILNYKKGKVVINFGTHLTEDHFHQVDESTGNVSNRDFLDWAPQGHFEYRFSQMKSIQLDYKGTTTQPTLEQLQPLTSDVDRLHIIVGNPNLTPSFTNAFNFNYRSYKVISDQFFGVYGNYTFVTNPIANHINYDPTTGASVSQYFNVPGKQSANFYGGFNFGRKIQSLGGLNTGIGFNVNGSNAYNYTNDSLDMSKNYVFNPFINLGMFKQKKIEMGFNGGPTYTISETSLQTKVNNNGWGARAGLNGTIYLPGKFQVGTYSDYQYNAATAAFPQSYSRINFSAFIIKNFLKNDNLMVELWGNDLLNQQSGFSRVATANVITQTVSNTLKRYFMLTINYDFTKMGAGVKQ